MNNRKKTPELERVLERLNKVKPSGAGYSAVCPAHPDHDPSMSVSLGGENQVIFNCHKGCRSEEIVAAIGLEMKDLFPPKEKQETRSKKQWVANYDYVDAEGNLVFQVTRWIENGKKTFTQRKPTKNGEWVYSTAGVDKPLYRLPEVVAAIRDKLPIYVAEGEKDVHTLEEMGVVATTNPGGASAWLPRHTATLKGADEVLVVADRDAVGMKRAQRIVNDLIDEGVNARAIAPPEGHQDVTDFAETGGELSGLVSVHFEDENMDPFAEVVTEFRGLVGKDWSMDRKLARARAILDNTQFDPTESGKLVRWDEFLNEPVDEYDWVIPGLLERQERLIVVAAEGVGKTMLARQVALLSAAGLQPFKTGKMEPVRTLFVDLENPERIIRRTSKKILERAYWARGGATKIDAHLLVKPDGINILAPEDRVFIERIVEQTQPDILFLGPLYKAYIDPGSRTSESVATEAAMFFDYIRSTYNCALWLEHHAPYGSSMTSRELRPFGSTVWSRWPEFGLSLSPSATIPYQYDIKMFRGARDDTREFPSALRRGDVFPFDAIWA